MLGNRTWPDWIAEYQKGHQNRWNQLTHTFGIPMILLSLPLGLIALFGAPTGTPALFLFFGGWALQFLGHAIEGQRPEFFKDWRFLLVGTRWWWAKVRGKV